MSPFRMFGRPPEPEPALEPDDDMPTWAPGPWHGDPGPATRHARPVGFGGGAPYRGVTDRGAAYRDVGGPPVGAGTPAGDGVDDDPPTDPYGFPPIPAAHTGAWAASPPAPVRPVPDAQEAAALAGAFAADYLSWDEDDPARRGRALADHLGAPVADPALLGWDGRGRQRAEFALPGLVRPDGDERVLVDVRVRVTPYREVGDRTPDVTGAPARAAGPEPDVPGVPAAASAPTGRGWRGCASYWVRLSVPVAHEDDRLVVDAADEAGTDVPGHAGYAPLRELPGEPQLAAPGPAEPTPALGPESAW